MDMCQDVPGAATINPPNPQVARAGTGLLKNPISMWRRVPTPGASPADITVGCGHPTALNLLGPVEKSPLVT
jgi:hypothetical protein